MGFYVAENAPLLSCYPPPSTGHRLSINNFHVTWRSGGERATTTTKKHLNIVEKDSSGLKEVKAGNFGGLSFINRPKRRPLFVSEGENYWRQ